ncbi:MAG: acyltransferase [Candidatus Sphingomonas colombiensis]|nr:acyltransferase [Sphingomonas sp.]WEK43771.1 MAG: acyltransferase [Sphingomonas sp.]
MRSSTGQHWIALDHVRAVAAFLVFTWHFMHSTNGYPVAVEGAPAFFPLAILDEGHTGVALFMTLSGYLFAKLLEGRAVRYPLFFLNRALRLAPLMVVAILIADLDRYLRTGEVAVVAPFVTVAAGFVSLAPLANGLWSIVVETHFYLVLPLLMMISRDNRWALLIVVGAALAVRLGSSPLGENAREASYWTIFGHIDQFILGIFAFQNRAIVRGRHRLAAVTALGFALFYYWFDAAGGLYGMRGEGWHAPVWAVLPTIEGAAYGLLIAYYDASFRPRDTGVSRLIGKAGAYSYSIYLLHFFVVFRMARFIDEHIMGLSNFYIACLWSLVCFASMVPFAQLCFRWIEAPFLKLRRPYSRPLSPREPPALAIDGSGASEA